jgi:hypothetical protein
MIWVMMGKDRIESMKDDFDVLKIVEHWARIHVVQREVEIDLAHR